MVVRVCLRGGASERNYWHNYISSPAVGVSPRVMSVTRSLGRARVDKRERGRCTERRGYRRDGRRGKPSRGTGGSCNSAIAMVLETAVGCSGVESTALLLSIRWLETRLP